MPPSEENTRISLVIPKWLDEVLEASGYALGVSKAKVAYWLLLSGWSSSPLGYDVEDVPLPEDVSIWTAEIHETISEIELELAVRKLDDEQQQQLLRRLQQAQADKKGTVHKGRNGK